MSEPRTAAGKALVVALDSAIMLSLPRAEYVPAIVAIETEAAADLLALHEALGHVLWGTDPKHGFPTEDRWSFGRRVYESTAPAAQAIKERIEREAVKPWRGFAEYVLRHHANSVEGHSLAELARALLAGTEGEKPTEFTWLIEAGSGWQPLYEPEDRIGDQTTWTRDPYEAHRYATREEAEAQIKHRAYTAKAVEHGFIPAGTEGEKS